MYQQISVQSAETDFEEISIINCITTCIIIRITIGTTTCTTTCIITYITTCIITCMATCITFCFIIYINADVGQPDMDKVKNDRVNTGVSVLGFTC